MFIETEATPNPNTLKFLPGRAVMAQGTASYKDATLAQASPLGRRLFGVDGIASVFFGADFVTVTKDGKADWKSLKPLVLAAITEHYAGDDAPLEMATSSLGQTDAGPIVAKIRELLDTRIRPMVANDGGDIVFRDFQDGIVFLHMQGACSGCPSATATLKYGVENMLKYYIPEVQAVEAVD